jgi:hypothetical protein
MKRIACLGCLAVGFTMLGALAQAQSIEIKTADNVDGRSQSKTAVGPGLVAQVEVANQVGDCRLREFFVAPGLIAKVDPNAAYIRAPDEIKGGKAILHLYGRGQWTVLARYVHPVLLEEGWRSIPEVEAPTTGQGEVHAGRALYNGYRYDHVDLVTEVIGPGGASARVAEAPYPGSPQADLRIRWYYDPFSKVTFSWRIYVKGPCDASP